MMLMMALLTIVTMQAQPSHRGGHRGPGDPAQMAEMRVQQLEKELQLSAQQKAAITEIYTRHANEMKAEMEQMRQNGGHPDRKAMEAKREAVQAEVEAVLNDNQKAKYAEMNQGMKRHHGKAGDGHHGKRGMRGRQQCQSDCQKEGKEQCKEGACEHHGMQQCKEGKECCKAGGKECCKAGGKECCKAGGKECCKAGGKECCKDGGKEGACEHHGKEQCKEGKADCKGGKCENHNP